MSVERPVVITIARQFGSGGSELGQRVARRLGFTYVDRQILQQSAEALGVDEKDLALRSERVQGFWARLLNSFAAGTSSDVYSPPPFQVPSDEQIIATERGILVQLADKGDCVIVGHAGFDLLRGRDHLLNVFVHAPQAFRIQRVMRYYAAPDESAALAMIEQADRDRSRYVHEVTGCTWQDACNFHLCIDAERMGLPAAEELVASLAHRMVEADLEDYHEVSGA